MCAAQRPARYYSRRKVISTAQTLQPIPIEARRSAMLQPCNPGDRHRQRECPDHPRCLPAGVEKQTEYRRKGDSANRRQHNRQVQISFEPEDPARGVIRRIGVSEAQVAHG